MLKGLSAYYGSFWVFNVVGWNLHPSIQFYLEMSWLCWSLLFSFLVIVSYWSPSDIYSGGLLIVIIIQVSIHLSYFLSVNGISFGGFLSYVFPCWEEKWNHPATQFWWVVEWCITPMENRNGIILLPSSLDKFLFNIISHISDWTNLSLPNCPLPLLNGQHQIHFLSR